LRFCKTGIFEIAAFAEFAAVSQYAVNDKPEKRFLIIIIIKWVTTPPQQQKRADLANAVVSTIAPTLPSASRVLSHEHQCAELNTIGEISKNGT
jgi:hypothetical protein